MSRARFASAITVAANGPVRSDRAQSAGNGFPPITHRQRVIGPPFPRGPFFVVALSDPTAQGERGRPLRRQTNARRVLGPRQTDARACRSFQTRASSYL